MSTPYIPGWVNDPVAVQSVLSCQAFPYFSQTPAGQVDTWDLPSDVFLWQAREKLTGQPWPSRNQGSVGSCVSFGTAAAVEASMAWEILLGDLEDVVDLCQEAIYGLSRVEIGGGRIGGDGSIGAWAAEAVKQYGLIKRGKIGSYDLSSYSESLCRRWGDKGLPDDLEPEAKLHLVKGISLVSSWEECKKALAQGYGIAVCSDRGFSMRRDSDGFASPSGSWAHCMAILGYQTGKREGGWICNSWGADAHSGPRGAGDPPPCGFWSEANTIDKMLRQQDSWAFSLVNGWPKRQFVWYI